MSMVDSIQIEGKRRKGRPKRKWKDSVRLDMEEIGLSEDMTLNKRVWRQHF